MAATLQVTATEGQYFGIVLASDTLVYLKWTIILYAFWLSVAWLALLKIGFSY